jgi:hypothetical protein
MKAGPGAKTQEVKSDALAIKNIASADAEIVVLDGD